MESLTKQKVAYNYLRDRIVNGGLLPGQRVIINNVATEIGMSAVPVREALVQLEADGLVQITPHVGAVVSTASVDELLQLMESVSILEGHATALARPHIGQQLPKLRAATAAMKASHDSQDWNAFNAHNREFHEAIYDACPNRFLVSMIYDLWHKGDLLRGRTIFFRIPTRADQSVHEHHEIINVLADPEATPAEIEAAARRHKLRTLETLTEYLQRMRTGQH